MAAKKQEKSSPKKRKQIPGNKPETNSSTSKKPKLLDSKPSNPRSTDFKKPPKPFKPREPGLDHEKQVPLSKQEGRLRAKELAEARKKKRKRHYNLEQELAHLWEKMRQRNISKEDRSKLVSEAVEKMKGKIPEIASSHVSSRVLQTCVKYCSQAEKDAVFEELQPHLLTLACNTYAVHLVTKMLDNASKMQLAAFISSLRGHVASLLRHMVGSVVVEHAYQLGNATQKHELLVELYSTELQLFKDLISKNEGRLLDIISKLDLQKSSVLRHMTSMIQPILEKGIIDHSIVHRVLIEYFTIAEQFSATDVIKQLSGPLLVRVIHTKDGSKVGMLCVKHGSSKERKKIIKGMKGHVHKIALDQGGSMVLVCLVSTVDDTKLTTKVVIHELQENLKDLVLDKNGRRPLLQLLHPNCSRYLTPDDLASLSLSIPSLSNKAEHDNSETKSSKVNNSGEEGSSDLELDEADTNAEDGLHSVEGGKKDPAIRRQELLVQSGLAEKLVDVCITSAGELLRSNFGKEVIYEVATGGAGGILHPTLDDKLSELYETIASLVAEPKSQESKEDSKEEHILENFHSSRTIRKLILDCPTFASTLWNKALKGKCELWAQGHSGKVIAAFLESSDSKVNQLAEKELKKLIDGGILKMPDPKVATGKKE
ncbi:pumilio 24-like [Pyrus ussuriensis x Pyrus communis]|uniref:Pumilio 24-like n=1 Tax=Pyrus ussuriensis x Pyrus communis TaxID=2448454 RepID=A0A5N5HG62_9ROSA|nr:pumilio 24-like [Pyrus ussuriensis x Pyrus communis]